MRKPGTLPDADGHRLALVTCWPFEATTQGPETVLADLLRAG